MVERMGSRKWGSDFGGVTLSYENMIIASCNTRCSRIFYHNRCSASFESTLLQQVHEMHGAWYFRFDL